jgi:hypothetical protein
MPEKFKDSNALAALSRQIRSQPIDDSIATKKRKLSAKPTPPPLPVVAPASSDLSTAMQAAFAALATPSIDTKHLQNHIENLQHHAPHHLKACPYTFQPQLSQLSVNNRHQLHTELALLATHLKAAILAEQQGITKHNNTNTTSMNQGELIDWHISQMATDYEADIAAALGECDDDNNDDDKGGSGYKGVFLRIMKSGVDVYSDTERRVIIKSCLS